MEYNPFQHQDQTNSKVLHAQEFTHMNNIAFPSRFKKKNQPTNPPNFQAKRANKPFIFVGFKLGGAVPHKTVNICILLPGKNVSTPLPFCICWTPAVSHGSES